MTGVHRAGTPAYDPGRPPRARVHRVTGAASPCEPGTGCRAAPRERRGTHERQCDGNCGPPPPAGMVERLMGALGRRREPLW